MPTQLDRYRGALLGLAAGDAVGTTLEFKPRGSFQPIDDMTGGGPFDLKPGQWTDDTSMALCLAASLIHCQGFDARDQMTRYCNWSSQGYMSSTGTCFDIGNTVAIALHRYKQTDEPFAGSTDPKTAGNGSLMRLAPIALFHYPDRQAAMHYAGESSRTTHGAQEAIDACKIFTHILISALDGHTKSQTLAAVPPPGTSKRLAGIAAGVYQGQPDTDIRGTGYVVDSLEAALWCFHHTDNFHDAVLAAANLGDDADTTAAVTGQIAGAYYGSPSIPESWATRLAHRDQITELADNLLQSSKNRSCSESTRAGFN